MDPYRVSNANNGHNNGNYNYDRARARSIIGGRRLGDGTLHSNQIPEAKRKHEDELNVLADNESKSAK